LRVVVTRLFWHIKTFMEKYPDKKSKRIYVHLYISTRGENEILIKEIRSPRTIFSK
jgi:hypothetical protein